MPTLLRLSIVKAHATQSLQEGYEDIDDGAANEQERKQREKGWPDSSYYYPKYNLKMTESMRRRRTTMPPT